MASSKRSTTKPRNNGQTLGAKQATPYSTSAKAKTASTSTPAIVNPSMVIKHPLNTEKGIRLMEAENTLVFVVDRSATKSMVKQAIEQLLTCHVKAVRTFNSHLGEKRAYVQFAADTPAIDIATNLGLM